MQADRLQQLLERLTDISIIIDNEYGWHILRAHNDAPQSKGKSGENLPSIALSPPIKCRVTTPDRLYRMFVLSATLCNRARSWPYFDTAAR
jgi:hypothetical protein